MLENSMIRPIEEKLTYYHTVKIKVFLEREIEISTDEDFDKAIERELDDMLEDTSLYDYEYDIIGGGEYHQYY